MAAGLILTGAAQIGGAVSEYYAMEAQSIYQREISAIDQKLSSFQAEMEIKRGRKEAQQLKEEAAGVIGSQRAAFAAQGVDVSSGTALEIQAQTAEQAARDAVTVRNNAWLSAWGIKVEATNRKYASRFQSQASQNVARSTLMTGGIKGAGSLYSAYADYKGLNTKTNKTKG